MYWENRVEGKIFQSLITSYEPYEVSCGLPVIGYSGYWVLVAGGWLISSILVKGF